MAVKTNTRTNNNIHGQTFAICSVHAAALLGNNKRSLLALLCMEGKLQMKRLSRTWNDETDSGRQVNGRSELGVCTPSIDIQ